MQPQIIDLPEKKLVGLGARFISILSPRKNNMQVIPALWDQFMERMHEIKNRKANASFGLVEDLPESQNQPGGDKHDELFYIACTEVTDSQSIPPGMIHRVIPAGRYAQFTHKGKLTGLERTMHFIYRTWLPAADVKLRDSPHIEVYDDRFDPGSDQSEFDVLLPIQ